MCRVDRLMGAVRGKSVQIEQTSLDTTRRVCLGYFVIPIMRLRILRNLRLSITKLSQAGPGKLIGLGSRSMECACMSRSHRLDSIDLSNRESRKGQSVAQSQNDIQIERKI